MAESALTARVDSTLVERLNRIARAEGQVRSVLVRAVLERFCEQWEAKRG